MLEERVREIKMVIIGKGHQLLESIQVNSWDPE